MARQERIAALQAQLDSSRKRRSALLGSLGKATELGGEGDRELSSPLNLLGSLASTPAPAQVERSDLSPSPGRPDPGALSGNDLPWDSPLGGVHSGLADATDGRPSRPDLGAADAAQRLRTKQLSDLQGKLAEATHKLDEAKKQALDDKKTQMQLVFQMAERDRRVQALEDALSREKREVQEHRDNAAELRKQSDGHEAAMRALQMEIHQKTLQFDRIQNQGLRQQSEGEVEARRLLLQTKDELLASKTEILELKSALNVHQKKEGEVNSQFRRQEEALQELRRKEETLSEALRQCKAHNSEHQLRMDKVKKDCQDDMALQLAKTSELSKQLSDAGEQLPASLYGASVASSGILTPSSLAVDIASCLRKKCENYQMA